MSFHVGQKVTLKDGAPWKPTRWLESVPIFGVVYTVREMVHHKLGPAILLHEIRNPCQYWSGSQDIGERLFDATEFRPVTDISVFTEMLKTEKVLT